MAASCRHTAATNLLFAMPSQKPPFCGRANNILTLSERQHYFPEQCFGQLDVETPAQLTACVLAWHAANCPAFEALDVQFNVFQGGRDLWIGLYCR